MVGLATLEPDKLNDEQLATTCRRLQSSALIDRCISPDRVRTALESGNRNEQVDALFKLKGAAKAKARETGIKIGEVRHQARVRETSLKRHSPQGPSGINRDRNWRTHKEQTSKAGPPKGNNPSPQPHGRGKGKRQRQLVTA